MSPRVVRVLPDVPAIDKTFDYLVPEAFGGQVRVGTQVRVELHGRRVGGWIVADDVTPNPGVPLRPLAKVRGWGPEPALFELASWAAWRWAGHAATFLRTASAEHAVTRLPRVPPRSAVPSGPASAELDRLAREAYTAPRAVVRVPPAVDPFPLVLEAVRAARQRDGDALVLAPGVGQGRHLGLRLRRAGLPTAVLPRDWAVARAGGSIVVGSRAGAWAPCPRLGAVLVLDEHDERYAGEGSPTWHARDVAIERARRAGVPCVLASPMPTLESQRWSTVLTPSRAAERAGWPIVDVVDRRHDDPTRGGLYSDRLVDVLRSDRRVVCVLNRTGRSRLLACGSCGAVATCEHCDAAVGQSDDGALRCHRCGTARPLVCRSCGATRLKNIRVGVSRAREELEALVREPVLEVTAATAPHVRDAVGSARVVVGTEAVLHLTERADVVAFLDLDQELLAPRYRAAEQALALLVLAARVVGGRGGGGGGRLLLQTRLPQHEVVQAALHADPARVSAAEAARRSLLRFPPASALAEVGGAGAVDFIAALGRPAGVEVLGPTDGHWLLRAADHRTLCDALAATPRPAGRLRLAVDPLRI